MSSIVSEARENLRLTEQTLNDMRDAAMKTFENTKHDQDMERTRLWAELQAIKELRRRLMLPIENQFIQDQLGEAE